MSITFQELKKKDVLEVNSGKNLGKVTDLVIEKRSGKILKIVVPGKKGGLFACENQEIPYHKIVKIGDDVILVDLCEDKKPINPCKKDAPCKPPCKPNDFDDCLDGFCDE